MKTTKLASCGTFIFALVLGGMLLGGPAGAQTVQPKLVAFRDFLQQVSRVAPASYLPLSTSRVKAAKSFEEMRQHILTMYGGVTVTHSFLLGSDPFDCVPIMQQPSVRLLGLKSIATEPPHAPVPSGLRPSNPPAGQPMIETGQLRLGQRVDALGNSVICEEATIPMRRITLDDLSRFETLQKFFEKGPDGAGQVRTPGRPVPVLFGFGHKHAASYQYVANVGGSSELNLWRPDVNFDLREYLSLSQQWYANYISPTVPQTVEAGWNVCPQCYSGSHNSHLFSYWTADGYGKTGCYNLNCAAFVQKSTNQYLGGEFQVSSIDGGTQYWFMLRYFLYQGNWWLNLGGQWIGYYPGTLFAGGPLATSATLIQYGGETSGDRNWPPMGSGMFANAWSNHAAFQRNVYYNGDPATTFYARLTGVLETSPSCYTVFAENNTGVAGWNTFLFFGGPGGTTC